MSKRKNTLNDLQEFLKLQASTLVQPQAVENSPQPISIEHAESKEQSVLTRPTQRELAEPRELEKMVSEKSFDINQELKSLAQKDRKAFYDAILSATESLQNGTKDVLLINTVLYLKHGENWKRGIEEYWRAIKS